MPPPVNRPARAVPHIAVAPSREFYTPPLMRSVLDLVLERAERQPDSPCIHAFHRTGTCTSRSFGQVAAGARCAAALLATRGIGKGDIVILVGTHHPDFVASWLGAVWIGAVPTVLAEPSVRIDKAIYRERLEHLVHRIDARVMAIDPRIELTLDIPRLTYEELASSTSEGPPPIRAAEQDLLLLQHSSGTTGLHKGVMLSHGAVMKHAEAYLPTLNLRPDDVIASWLPLYHDMGLIACFVCPLIAGIPVVWLSPFEWIASPALLLEAIDKFRATLVWLPNFAFALLGQRARSGLYRMDSLRMVINCSEPVSEAAMSSFAARFAPDGLRAESLHSCYAMAENVFAVTASNDDVPPRTVRRNGRTYTSSGIAVPGCEVRIRDGRILIKSDFLLSGYFRRDDLNAGVLDSDGFFDTGDLGWIDEDGHLYVTGRAKDLVIVGGRNVFPQDIEEIANETEDVRRGRVVCFGVPVKNLETEGLVLLVESDKAESDWRDIEGRLRAAIPQRLDLDLVDARVIPSGQLAKSTSGKLARGTNREKYLRQEFGPLPVHIVRSE
ncbi:MAG: AMP-binding protein [Acidobacteria bacterium]|nr:AMP-binding protein [Acidobacteriota bacterium]